YPTNLDDVIDSRDVIDAITNAYDSYVEGCEAENLESHSAELWAVHGCLDGPLGSPNPDMVALVALAKQGEDYSVDWEYGETLVRDSYFTEYARELTFDCGYWVQVGRDHGGG